MNILPLVISLVLMLTVLMVERLEKFKNSMIVQNQYQLILDNNSHTLFNERQKYLFQEDYKKNIRHLSFRYLFDKNAREKHPEVAKQYRMLIHDLMRNLYSEAKFYKELEKRRSNFLEELLMTIENAADQTPPKYLKRLDDLTRLALEDEELQKAFYHMLKGTIEREKLLESAELTPRMKEKSYVSLFNFINDHGADRPPSIEIQHCPREILKTIFESDEVVNQVIEKRNELNKENGGSLAFKSEFLNKRRPGINENLLDFKITDTKKTAYD